MNISEIKKIAPLLMKNNVVPYLHGQQGDGKTQVAKQIAQELGIGFVQINPATQEPGDLVGLLIVQPDGTAKHSRPEWFPTSGKGIVFIDELPRAHTDTIQCLFSFINEKTIHRHVLPEGWHIMAAGNYQSNEFNQNDDTADSAWTSRFCHIDFQPTVEEFLIYAESKGNFGIADYIRTHPEMLRVKQKERFDMQIVKPCPRSWNDMIGCLDKEDLGSTRYEVYAGIIGTTTAASYMTHKRNAEERLSGRDVLNRYDAVRERILDVSKQSTVRFDLLDGAVEEILTMLPKMALTEPQMDNFKAFILDLPLEMSLKLIDKLTKNSWSQKDRILNNVEFVQKFERIKLQAKQGR